MQIVQQRRLLRTLLEALLLDPHQIPAGPRRGALGGPTSLAQQELSQPMPGSQLITLGRQACTHQIAQRLVRRIRHPHRRQIPGPVAAGELLDIAPIGLDPVAGLHRHQRRGHHLAVHAQLRQLPVQHVAGRSGLIAHPQARGLAELVSQAAHRLGPVRNGPQTAHFDTRLSDRHRNRLRMDI